VADDHPLGPILEVGLDGPGDLGPVAWSQVLAVDREERLGPQVVHVRKAGHREGQFLGRQRGVDGTGAVVHVRGDGPARPDDGQFRKALGAGDLLHWRCPPLGPLHDGHVTSGVHADPHVVTVGQLEDDDVLVGELVVGHEQSHVGATLLGAPHLEHVTHLGLRLPQELTGDSHVTALGGLLVQPQFTASRL
jgi:hypothetical protein